MVPDEGSRLLRPTPPRRTFFGQRALVILVSIAVAIAGAWAMGNAACGPADEPLPPRSERPPIDLLDAGDDDAATGGPCVEGTTRPCKIIVGQQGTVTTCIEGTRTCRQGVWSECEGSLTETSGVVAPHDSEKPTAPSSKAEKPFAISDAVDCPNNPCDPSCQCFNEVPPGGIVLTPHISGYYYEGSLEDAIAHSPQGFIDKGLKTPCNTTNDCQFDFHCVNQACVPWGPGETISGCNKPNLTTGFACTLKGDPTIPVCNRGNVTAPVGIALFIFPGNSPQFPTCVPDNQPEQCLTTKAIPPGACIDVLNCPGLKGKGNKTIMVNPPLAPPSGAPNPKWVDECTCEDNWGNWSGSDTFCQAKPNYDTEPLAYSQIYHGECPAGARVQWGYMTYDSSTPSDSNILIQAHTALSPTQLPSAPLITLGTAKAIPAPDTQVCTYTSPAGCPLDLYTSLQGVPLVTNPYLELVFTLNPSITKAQAPTLRTWSVTYSCPWTE